MGHESLVMGKPCFSPRRPRLQEILSLKRLQSLEHYHLKLYLVNTTFNIYTCAHQLRIILSHPSIRKLSLNTLLPLDNEAHAKLAPELVKFEEVHLSEDGGPVDNSVSLLRSLTSASARGGSKLKKLVICLSDVVEKANPEIVTEARERFAVDIVTVTMISLIERDSDNDYYSDDDYSDNDYSDDDYSDDDNSGEF